MNRLNIKGFTLVEVLAVIAIISIISVLITVGILGYFQSGKDDYNNKLRSQLVLAAKTYYADNREELPPINGENYAYLTLSEMQSRNYITRSFSDSEKRDCSLSYVYVELKENTSNEYKYVPCLVCQEGTNLIHFDSNGKQASADPNEKCNMSLN